MISKVQNNEDHPSGALDTGYVRYILVFPSPSRYMCRKVDLRVLSDPSRGSVAIRRAVPGRLPMNL